MGVDADVDFLVKLKRLSRAVALRERRVVSKLVVISKLQFRATLCLHPHASRTKDLLSRAEVKVHVGKVKLVLSLRSEERVIAHLEVVEEGLSLRPFHILLRRHPPRLAQKLIPQLCAHLIHPGLLVVDGCVRLDVLRVFEIHGKRLGMSSLWVVRLLHLDRISKSRLPLRSGLSHVRCSHTIYHLCRIHTKRHIPIAHCGNRAHACHDQ